MPYVRLDDTISDNRKTVKNWAVDPAVFGLDVRAIAWCGKHLTDGHVPADILDEWFGRHGDAMRARLCEQLVISGRWDERPDGDGYQIHDYLDYNPSKAQVEDRVEARKKAGAKGGKKSKRGPAT
jgi:hypothetical protein